MLTILVLYTSFCKIPADTKPVPQIGSKFKELKKLARLKYVAMFKKLKELRLPPNLRNLPALPGSKFKKPTWLKLIEK